MTRRHHVAKAGTGLKNPLGAARFTRRGWPARLANSIPVSQTSPEGLGESP